MPILGPRRVFRNLSLDLRLGEHTVILGPNGAGKSALIKLLSREIYPVVKPGSRLRIFGEETVNLWDLRRRVGMVSPDLQTRTSGTVPAADVVLSGFFGSVGIGLSQQPTERPAAEGAGAHGPARPGAAGGTTLPSAFRWSAAPLPAGQGPGA
jgi:ABC-type molybdenum transport system ATPase subunit/photorepair protein PhrA